MFLFKICFTHRYIKSCLQDTSKIYQILLESLIVYSLWQEQGTVIKFQNVVAVFGMLSEWSFTFVPRCAPLVVGFIKSFVIYVRWRLSHYVLHLMPPDECFPIGWFYTIIWKFCYRRFYIVHGFKFSLCLISSTIKFIRC